MPETHLEEAVAASERLREIVAGTKIPIEGGLPIRFHVSIGVTSLQTNEDNLDVLLHQADVALYEAKRSGRNKVCVRAQ